MSRALDVVTLTGEKTNPSDATLAKLGLKKEVIYVLQ